MKSEPEVFSIDDLAKNAWTAWEGVRNYQARNFLRDSIKVGDLVLIYHSNTKPPGVAGLAEVIKSAYPDDTAWDPKSQYYDPKSSPENPIWYRVDLQFKKKFKNYISLDAIKENPALTGILVAKKGQRLSVQPLDKQHFEIIKKLGK